MSMRRIIKDRKATYDIIYWFANCFLVIAVVLFVVYSAASLLGGKLFVGALIKTGTWIIVALSLRAYSQRGRKELKLRVGDSLHYYAAGTLFLIVTFNYPVNIILCIINTIACAVSFKVNKDREEKEDLNSKNENGNNHLNIKDGNEERRG